MMTREGEGRVARARRRGANLVFLLAGVSGGAGGVSGLLNANEDALDVQVHDFRPSALGGLVERRAPRGAGVGEQDVDMVGMLGDFCDEALDFGGFGDVCGDGDGFAGEGKGVEGGAGFFAGGRFARGDEDFGAAGLNQAGGGVES